MLKVVDLSKKYKSALALNHLNMEIKKGELYGLIGENGSGKTTAIRIIAGLIKATSGEVWIDGVQEDKNRNLVKRKIGYVPDHFGTYSNINVTEYMEFYTAAFGMYGNEAKERVCQVLDLVELLNVENRYVDELSEGMQHRLCLARALLHNPSLIIMDEPGYEIDPSIRQKFKRIFRNLWQEGYTTLIASHCLADLSDLCTNVGIIHQGRMALQGNIEDILYDIDTANPILITVFKKLDTAVEILKKCNLVERISIERNRISILFEGTKEEEAILLKQMIEAGVYVTSFQREYTNLETLFSQLREQEKGREKDDADQSGFDK